MFVSAKRVRERHLILLCEQIPDDSVLGVSSLQIAPPVSYVKRGMVGVQSPEFTT